MGHKVSLCSTEHEQFLQCLTFLLASRVARSVGTFCKYSQAQRLDLAAEYSVKPPVLIPIGKISYRSTPGMPSRFFPLLVGITECETHFAREGASGMNVNSYSSINSKILQ